jgi:hypothetical protein
MQGECASPAGRARDLPTARSEKHAPGRASRGLDSTTARVKQSSTTCSRAPRVYTRSRWRPRVYRRRLPPRPPAQAPAPYRVPERRRRRQNPSKFDGGSTKDQQGQAEGTGGRARARAATATAPASGIRVPQSCTGRECGHRWDPRADGQRRRSRQRKRPPRDARDAPPLAGGPHRPRMEASQPTFPWAGLPVCCHPISA